MQGYEYKEMNFVFVTWLLKNPAWLFDYVNRSFCHTLLLDSCVLSSYFVLTCINPIPDSFLWISEKTFLQIKTQQMKVIISWPREQIRVKIRICWAMSANKHSWQKQIFHFVKSESHRIRSNIHILMSIPLVWRRWNAFNEIFSFKIRIRLN